jgi:hypothetical protein
MHKSDFRYSVHLSLADGTVWPLATLACGRGDWCRDGTNSTHCPLICHMWNITREPTHIYRGKLRKLSGFFAIWKSTQSRCFSAVLMVLLVDFTIAVFEKTLIKGTVSRDGYFLGVRYKLFNQYFLCMRWWFSRSFKSFSQPFTIIIFLFASLKLFTNFENAPWYPNQNSFLCS